MAEEDLANALKRRRQISITVTGRRTGRAITIPTEICSNPNHLDYHDRDEVQQAARLAEELGPGDALKRPAHPQ